MTGDVARSSHTRRSDLGHSLGPRAQALMREGTGQQQQAEDDHRDHALDGAERREVVEEHLGGGDHQQCQSGDPHLRPAQAQSGDQDGDPGDAPQGAEPNLTLLVDGEPVDARRRRVREGRHHGHRGEVQDGARAPGDQRLRPPRTVADGVGDAQARDGHRAERQRDVEQLSAAREQGDGLKPTYGLVSRAGVYANSFTFDHAGPMTWTVEDCAIMLQAIAGHDPKDPASADRPIPDYRAALTGDIRGLRIGIVRHLYEDDMTVAPEVRAALDEAYAVFRSLGAVLEDVRIRPAADYYAVKITIAESEQYAIHEEELRTRPGDFGADFLGRALPRSLQRHRLCSGAARATADAGGDGADLREIRCAGHAGGARAGAPARNLADHQLLAEFVTDDALQCHRRPGAGAMHGVHAGRLAAVVAACRPPIRRGDRAAGRACLRDGDELARPQAQLDPAATFSSEPPPAIRPEPVGDPAVRDIVVAACRRAELSLDDSQIDMICAAAPYVMAMTRRLRRERDFREEPANIFQFPE